MVEQEEESSEWRPDDIDPGDMASDSLEYSEQLSIDGDQQPMMHAVPAPCQDSVGLKALTASVVRSLETMCNSIHDSLDNGSLRMDAISAATMNEVMRQKM